MAAMWSPDGSKNFMAENEKKSHWSELAQELGAPLPSAETKRQAIVPSPKPAERKRPEANTPPAKPKSSWSDVAASLGLDAASRPGRGRRFNSKPPFSRSLRLAAARHLTAGSHRVVPVGSAATGRSKPVPSPPAPSRPAPNRADPNGMVRAARIAKVATGRPPSASSAANRRVGNRSSANRSKRANR